MPDYRDVKRPTALIKRDLTDDELSIVMAGGNEAAIGTDVAGAHATQLDLWYLPEQTLVAGRLEDATFITWSFNGHVSPHDCREWYLAKVRD